MTTTYDIDEFQKKIPEIAADLKRDGGHFIVTQKRKPSLVAISYREYEEFAEIAQEVRANNLKGDVRKARREYEKGKYRDFQELLNESL